MSSSSTALKTLHLYTSPLSGCSARIRIAANLKSIPLIHHPISISTDEQSAPDYLLVNPNASVPSLVISDSTEPPSGSPPPHGHGHASHQLIITQSPAILDYLEAHYPWPRLVPPIFNVVQRARAMELTSLVACDIQPPQNSRIRRKIREFGGDGEAWARYVYDRGFQVYETFLERAREERARAREQGSSLRESGGEHEGEVVGAGEELVGRYSVGDEVTMADVFLVPAVQGGLRVGVELHRYPLVKGIVEEYWKLEAFRKGGVGGHGRLIP